MANNFPIVLLQHFIEATRDSGYKGTASALAELVDNSLEAGAKNVWVGFSEQDPVGLVVSVRDDGCGMSPQELRQALQFGGSSRFLSQDTIGRYGMGLPNSSVSQARRVEVFTWRDAGPCWYSYLDVTEIAEGRLESIPLPKRRALPTAYQGQESRSGTLVIWSQCDRLDFKKITTLDEHLRRPLGRMFRHFLYSGRCIWVNGVPIKPVDPLMLNNHGHDHAEVFGEPLVYPVKLRGRHGGEIISKIEVRFSLLPIRKWHCLTDTEKRALGISNNAGVSIIRGLREVDYGWFFTGSKRRENYDDWWRCEVRFQPALDNLFGVTHTKQQIRPTPALHEILTKDMEATARRLNGLVRKVHEGLGTTKARMSEDRQLMERDGRLPALPTAKTRDTRATLGQNGDAARFHIKVGFVHGRSFYDTPDKPGMPMVILNQDHPFCREVFLPLTRGEIVDGRVGSQLLNRVLLALARADINLERRGHRKIVQEHREHWSDALFAYLGK